MNKNEYVILDTNCLGYFLNGESLELNMVGSKQIVISEITEMEIQCDKLMNAQERKMLKIFLSGITIIPLNDFIKEINGFYYCCNFTVFSFTDDDLR
jgi:predicted nucleic acid-binding protein